LKIILFNIFYKKGKLGIGDWGLGIGEWGLGVGPNAQSPIPNPQSPKKKNIFLILYVIFNYE